MTVPLLQILFGLLLLGNMVAFAGVDPAARTATAVIALVFAVQLRKLPTLPRSATLAVWGLAALPVVQLIPLPEAVRTLLQPGFAEVAAPGWAPLSLAPWATLQVAASLVVFALIAVQANRMAQTRSGLPILLILLTATGVTAAILGLIAESGDPASVLFVRDNPFGGSVYGPFVNRNHFAQAMELTLPAALALLAAAVRRLPDPGLSRQKAIVATLAFSGAAIVCLAALIRSSSRGGVLIFAVALLLTAGWWRRHRRAASARVALAIVLVFGLAVASLSWNRLGLLRERFADLVAVEGLEGNTRIDFWRGTAANWSRSPILGSGLGTYRFAIGLDKPATGSAILEQAHNDWLEWASTTGLVGMLFLGILVTALVRMGAPSRVRRLRSELRYAMAGAALALVATALHEVIGFGLQTPINRYLLAAWIGLVTGLWARTNRSPAQLEEPAP